MAYTWEQVMMGIDVKNEQARKAEQQRLAEKEMADESSAAGAWSLGLSLLGGALFGPVGYFLGKQAGKYGADITHDWESMEMEEGKFNVAEAKEFNRTLTEAADDQTKGQILDTVLDLGKMYIQSGGLTAEAGELDVTTFGSGEGEWSLFGKGTPGTAPTTLAGEVGPEGWSEVYDIGGTSPSADYVPSLWSSERGVFDNLGQVFTRGQGLVAQDQAMSTLTQFGQEVYEAKKNT